MKDLRVAATAILLLATGCGDDADDGEVQNDPDGGALAMEGGTPDGGQVAEPPDAGQTVDAEVEDARSSSPPPNNCDPGAACDPFGDEDAGTCEGACRVDSNGRASCGELVANPQGEGEGCDFKDECAPGLDCINFDGEAVCTRMCPVDSVGFCGSGRQCSGRSNSSCVMYCRPMPAPCDIYEQDCADSDEACTLAINEETDERYTGCYPAGGGGEGDACDSVRDCGKGLVCVGSACRQVCRRATEGEELPCPDGLSCSGRSQSWEIPYCR